MPILSLVQKELESIWKSKTTFKFECLLEKSLSQGGLSFQDTGKNVLLVKAYNEYLGVWCVLGPFIEVRIPKIQSSR